MSRNLTEDLAADLRLKIVDGVIQPGDKLPSENDLMGEFGVSRTVVRAALTRLQVEGLVETERGRGSFALTPPPEGPSPLSGGRAVTSQEDRLHLFEFRIGVEVEAAALAARNGSDRQLKTMLMALESFATSGEHPAHAMKADYEFHCAIAAATGNPFFSDALAALGQKMIAMPRPRLMTDNDPDTASRFEQAVQEHRAIYAAIADGDQAASSAAMRSHLVNSRRRLGAPRHPRS